MVAYETNITTRVIRQKQTLTISCKIEVLKQNDVEEEIYSNCFIVMQGDTYQQEKQLEMIWSPQKDKGGHEPLSWLRMTQIQ